MERFACLWVPDFGLAAKVRAEPALARAAAALLEGPANAPRVAAATLEAAAAGIRAGQSLPQARALLPGLLVRPRDLLAERAAAQALREAAEAFSPRVEAGGAGVFFLDISGEAAEAALAEALLGRAREAGLEARVGAADSRACARAAAEVSAGSPVLVRPGGAAAFLAPRPLACLYPGLKGPENPLGHPDPALAERLVRWGIKTAGALARLPAGEVSARLGPEGLSLHRASRGLDERDFVPEPHPPRFFEGMGLDWPVAELEQFSRLARQVLERLAGRLASRGLACRKLEVTLELDPAGCDARPLALAAPTRDPKTWLGLLCLDLARRPPAAPVIGVSVLAAPEEPRSVQLTLFGPPAASPDKVATTLARLSARLGPGRVGRPEAVDSHRPESFAVADYELPHPREAHATSEAPRAPAAEAPQASGHIALRVLRPRVALTVRSDAAGRPAWVSSSSTEPDLAVEGAIRVASGPWRLEDGWWTEDAACREYWDVELSDGALYRIFRELARGSWYADGIYD